MTKNIFAQLRSSYGYLTRVERTLADLILDQPQRFVDLTMAALAAELGISQGSINNFSKKFSPGGFSVLKIKVASQLSTHGEEEPAAVDVHNVKDAMRRKMDRLSAVFSRALDINEEQTLQSVVRRILSARKIAIYGVFHSGITARDFCYRLIQLGIPATFVEDTLMCAVSASMLDETALVIAVSSSGRTSDIINAVEIAKKNKVPVVCLTSNPFSPLAKLSDEVLLSAVDADGDMERVGDVRMAQLFVIDTLCFYLYSVMEPGDRRHWDELYKIINSHSIED